MGILDKLVIGGGLALVGSGIAFLFRDARETAKRKNTPPVFSERLTEQDFVEMVKRAARKMPRVIGVGAEGLTAHVFVRSNSGLTQWHAELDFNDYGHATGRYWITSENAQSSIPEAIAKELQREIQDRFVA